jgi:hypothetical protein
MSRAFKFSVQHLMDGLRWQVAPLDEQGRELPSFGFSRREEAITWARAGGWTGDEAEVPDSAAVLVDGGAV